MILSALIPTITFPQTQSQSQTFPLPNRTEQDRAELGVGLRILAEIPTTPQPDGLSVTGTPEQLAFAKWLLRELEQAPPAAATETTFAGETVRLVPLRPDSLQDRNEIATAVRVIADIRRVFVPSARKLMVIRTSRDQADLASWLTAELNQPSAPASPLRNAADERVRVFYLPSQLSMPAFQEQAAGIRTLARCRRVLTVNAPRALILRGTPEQLRIAEWMTSVLNAPDRKPSQSFNLDAGETITVFAVAPQTEVPDLMRTFAEARKASGALDSVAVSNSRLIVMRGTPDQIAKAQTTISGRSQ
jgi:hypothetical protein